MGTFAVMIYETIEDYRADTPICGGLYATEIEAHRAMRGYDCFDYTVEDWTNKYKPIGKPII